MERETITRRLLSDEGMDRLDDLTRTVRYMLTGARGVRHLQEAILLF